jgi:adenylyltransferase/sulfurtransferase
VSLTSDERARYARHLLLPEVGIVGQARLKDARVLLVGVGGLGCPAATYLTCAGVGHLTLLDDDRVERSNLQRQPLHTDSDVGRLKVDSAREKLTALNPHVTVEAVPERLKAQSAMDQLTGFDVVLNGADNFAARYLVSDVCIRLKTPWVHGALHRFDGEISLFTAGGPCYRCLHPTPPAPEEAPSCAEAGVLGVLPGIVGSLMAAEALKLLLGISENLSGKLLLFDALAMRTRILRFSPREGCFGCAGEVQLTELTGEGCPRSATNTPTMKECSPIELKALLDSGETFRLIDVREPHEWEIGHIEGAELVPLATVPTACAGWDHDERLVLMCRSGKRSADALAHLAQQGFTDLTNLRGGILAWSDSVDPSIPKY